MRVSVLFFFVLFVSSICWADNSLAVISSDSATYSEIENGEVEITISHYLLSDSSLYFVKFLWNDVNYTLPRGVSASGVRYSNGMELTWWENSESALLQTRDSLGHWETVFKFVLSESP